MKYKNNSDQPLVIVNIGEVPAGAEFTTDKVIENPNIKVLDDKPSEATPEPAPVESATPTDNTGGTE